MTKITLTFDNGPTPGVTEHVLDTLAERSLLATFFVIGQKAATPEGAALVREARTQGHWIGNHTLTHGEPLGLLGDAEREVAEIADAHKILGLDAESRRLFRPTGHGKVGQHLLTPASFEYLQGKQYTVVLWSLFVRDTKMPADWAQRALDRLGERDWHVLVVHDVPSGAMNSLPWFLDAALDQGVEFVQEFPPEWTPMISGKPVEHFAEKYVTPQSPEYSIRSTTGA